MSNRYTTLVDRNKQNNQESDNNYVALIEQDANIQNQTNNDKRQASKDRLIDILTGQLPIIGEARNKVLPLVEKDIVKRKNANSSEVESAIKKTLLDKYTYIDAVGTIIDPYTFRLGKKTLRTAAELFIDDKEKEAEPKVHDEKKIRKQVNEVIAREERAEQAKKKALQPLQYLKQANIKYLNDNSPLRNGETDYESSQRAEVANFVGLLIRNNIVPDDYMDLVKEARKEGVPIEHLLYMSRDNLRLFDAARKSQTLKIGGIDTPITRDIFKNPDIVMRGRDNYEQIEQLERIAYMAWLNGRRHEVRQSLIRGQKIHSTGAVDNLIYGLGTSSLAVKFMRDYASGKIDDLTGFVNSFFSSKEEAEAYYRIVDRNKDKRTKDLVDYAQKVGNLPRDMRPNNVTEEYSKNGLLAAINYAVKNHDMGLSLAIQDAPTALLSAGLGRIITTPVKLGVTKTALSKVAQQRISNLSLGVMTSGLHSAMTTYPTALDEGFKKTGDYKKAKEIADKRALIEGTAGAISGAVPDIVKGEGIGKQILNNYLKNQIQSLIGVGGNATASYVIDGEVNTDALISNLIVGQVSGPYQFARDHLGHQVAKHFDEKTVHSWQMLKDTFSTLRKMSLTEKDPETTIGILQKLNDVLGNQVKKVYVALDEIIKYASENNIEPADLIEKVTGNRDLYHYAQVREIDVPIPYPNYAVYIGSKQKADSGINAHIKIEPDAITPYEFIIKNEQINNAQKDMIIDVDASVRDQAHFIKNDKVYDTSYKQGLALGLTEQQAVQQALIYYSFFKNLTDTYNINSTDLFHGKTFNLINIKDSVVTSSKNESSFVTFKNGKFEIDLGASLDSNNLINSSGEFILNNLANMSKLAKNDKALAKDINNIKKLLGVDNLNNINETHQKRFNSYLDSYLKDGSLYSSDLAPTFQKFNKVFLNVYRLAKNLDLPIDNKMRQRLDHFLMAEEAVEIVNSSDKLVFGSAQEAGMTESQYKKYVADYQQYKERAKEIIYDNYLKSAEAKKWQKNRDEIYQRTRVEVDNEPVFQLIDYFTKNILPDGSKTNAKKLDRDIILKRYGEEVANKLEYFTTTKDGVNPDHIAEMWGYRSADEMIGFLKDVPDRELTVIAITDALMHQRYGDNPNYVAMNERALKASQNEARAKFLQNEAIQLDKYRLLEKNKRSKNADDQFFIDNGVLSDEMLKYIANKLVESSNSFDIEPTLYLMAGRKANERAYLAARKKDWETALKEKEKERLNHFLYLITIERTNRN